MKKMTKLSALILAVLMIALTGSAFAATALDGGIEGDTDDTASVQDNTVTIMKELKVYNTAGGNIYLPTVGYTYTITGETVADSTTVTDSGDHTGKVYTGDTAALTGVYKVEFSASTASGYGNDGTATAVTITQPTAAATTGTSYYGGFQITVDPDTLGHPGIFRYKIVETEDSTNTQAKAGVTNQGSDYQSVRYLDVYIRRAVEADNASTTYVVYGYVLWYPVSTEDQDTSITKVPNVNKTNGYVGEQGGAEYNTYNLTVTKAIEGTLADKNHQFPFQVVFTSPNATAATIHYKATNGAPADTTTATLSSAATTTIGTLLANDDCALKLSNGGSVTFYGIPAGVTATVQENNDTHDVYAAAATVTAKTPQTYNENQVQAYANATIITGLDNATTTDAVGSADTTTAWTNTLSIVSPTGLVIRFAPYALLLIGGVVLLVIATKHRKHNEEE